MSISVIKSVVDVIIRTLSLIFANYPVVLIIIKFRCSSSSDNIRMKKLLCKDCTICSWDNSCNISNYLHWNTRTLWLHWSYILAVLIFAPDISRLDSAGPGAAPCSSLINIHFIQFIYTKYSHISDIGKAELDSIYIIYRERVYRASTAGRYKSEQSIYIYNYPPRQSPVDKLTEKEFLHDMYLL